MGGEALRLLERPDWFKDAKCRGQGPDRFFLEELTFDVVKQHFLMSEKAFKRLRKIDQENLRREIEQINRDTFCDVCPVKTECGEYGKFEAYGQWGGKNLEERFKGMGEVEQWEFFKSKETKDKNL